MAGGEGIGLQKELWRVSLFRSAFYRHDGIYRPIWPQARHTENLRVGYRLPLVGPRSLSPRTRRKERILLIVQMSSDRLFLNRVARQQSPSPLRRYPQINMHFAQPQAKGTFLLCPDGDISTLP